MKEKTSDYQLTNSDMDAVCSLLRMQHQTGASNTKVGRDQLWKFIIETDNIVYDHWRLVSNQYIKNWLDSVLTEMIKTDTCYGCHAAGMYILYMYYQFNVQCKDPYECGQKGFPLPDPYQRGAVDPNWDYSTDLPYASPWNIFRSLWKPPGNHPAFMDSVTAEMKSLNLGLHRTNGSSNAIALESPGQAHTHEQILEFQQSRFDPVNWTDSGKFLQNIYTSGPWKLQAELAAKLIKEPTVTPEAYSMLLLMLGGLTSGNTEQQKSAAAIISASCSSPEYPNDTFINQLIYFVAMTMADPLGTYAFNNTQLQSFFKKLEECITTGSDSAEIMRKSIKRHLKILNSDAAYPMQDPYNPATGFTVRQADTIAALDIARAEMKL